jgi:hypothetical protein
MKKTEIMEDIKLTRHQEKFVKLANENGFTIKISRKDIIILQAKYGIKWPVWLVKNTIYRYDRGVYKLPSLLSVEEHIANIVKSFGERMDEEDEKYY